MFEKARGANVVKYKELDLQVEVNGSEENPIFTFLKSSLPNPSDSKVVVVVKLMSAHLAHEHKNDFSVRFILQREIFWGIRSSSTGLQ